MNVIAHKREGVGVMYLVCTFLGLVFIGIGAALLGEGILLILFGILLSAVSGYIFYGYVSLPYAVIQIDGEDNLHLPKGKTISLCDVLDVSYRRASAKGIQYKWGSVTLTTRLGKYKYGYIADCEEVAKNLTDMMYRARFENAEQN